MSKITTIKSCVGWIPKSVDVKDVVTMEHSRPPASQHDRLRIGGISRIKGTRKDWLSGDWPPTKVAITIEELKRS